MVYSAIYPMNKSRESWYGLKPGLSVKKIPRLESWGNYGITLKF